MSNVEKSLAPLKQKVRDLLRGGLPDDTREALIGSLLEQAYFTGIVDNSKQQLEELKRAKL